MIGDKHTKTNMNTKIRLLEIESKLFIKSTKKKKLEQLKEIRAKLTALSYVAINDKGISKETANKINITFTEILAEIIVLEYDIGQSTFFEVLIDTILLPYKYIKGILSKKAYKTHSLNID